MAAESVGQIGLDLVVNQGSFNKQMAGIQGVAKKAGAALAAAFAVKKIVDFSAQCIELGSDLQEVQNVVEVTFPRMKRQVDSFAQSAAASFGLSETMAKKFTGTFGSMAKAFGFGERQAYEMSTALTGLAGDVASFYNLSQDEAYTKLKSVFSGETETLKDLGVVMSQSALDAYALANGFGKTTSAMSEMEKVSLRYAFVQDQLSAASGDFIRTSNGWANQVRILKLQFDSLKATIGQGLINVLTPVLQVINTLIGKIMTLANAFKAFTELLTGKDSSASSTSAAEAVVSGIGSAAQQTAKDLKNVVTGIDELNIIDADVSGGSAGGSGYAVDDFDMGKLDTAPLDELDSRYKKLIDRMKELAKVAKKGFWDGFGDMSVFKDIQESVGEIRDSLKNIFTDSDLLDSVNQFADSVAYSFGQVVGSIGSIGSTIADILLGGINLYLKKNGPRIKDSLISLFDIGADISSMVGELSDTVAEIFAVFRSDEAKQIIADVLQIFSDVFFQATELIAKFGRDFIGLITEPIIQNQAQLEEALRGLLEVIQPITTSIADTVRQSMEGIRQLYDEKIAPLILAFTEGISEIVNKILEAFNTHILPVLQEASEKFQQINEGSLQPLIKKFLEFAGKTSECIRQLWTQVLQPFVSWFVENVAPLIGKGLSMVVDNFFATVASISEALGYVFDALGGVIDFITGVFTGDWERAWEGIKDIFKGIFNGIISLLEGAVNAIVSGINSIIGALNSIRIDVPDWVPELGGKTISFGIAPISRVSLPRLAEGGFVQANTPQLAIIGDNRHHGEIVAPEDKLQEMVDRAVLMASQMRSNAGDQYLSVMVELLRHIIELIENMDLTVNIDIREIKKKLVDLDRRTGYELRPV